MASLVDVTAEGDALPKYLVRWRQGGRDRSRTCYSKEEGEQLRDVARGIEDREKAQAKALGLNRPQLAIRERTFADAAEEWLSTVLNERTRGAHRVRLKVHVLPTLGERKIRAIPPGEIVALTTSDPWMKLAPSSRASVFQSMRAVFAHGEDARMLTPEENPCRTKMVVRTAPKLRTGVQPDAWPEAWVQGVLREIREDIAIFPLLGAFCGLRQGEIFGLSPDDIVTEGGRHRLLVRRQVLLGSDARQYFGPPKHRRGYDEPRVVPVSESVWQALRTFMETHPPREVTLPWSEGDGSPLKPHTARLFLVTREGGAWNRNYFNTRVWKPALAEVGLEPTRVNGTHALRHWFACQVMAQPTGSLAKLSDMLGHRDRAFTLNVYGRYARDGQHEVVDAMGSLAASMLTPAADAAP